MKARTSGAVQGIMFLLDAARCRSAAARSSRPSTMPGWLQAFTNVNPITHLVDAVRGLMLGGPVATHLLWTLAWMAGLLVVFVPLATARLQAAGLSPRPGRSIDRGHARLAARLRPSARNCIVAELSRAPAVTSATSGRVGHPASARRAASTETLTRRRRIVAAARIAGTHDGRDDRHVPRRPPGRIGGVNLTTGWLHIAGIDRGCCPERRDDRGHRGAR